MATGTTVAATLTDDEVRAARLRSLLLGAERGASRGVGQIVEWMGALQAQDVASQFWSLGVRMPGSVEADVQAALEAREAVRTWPMRGTVHLVPARDAAWMVELMSARPIAGGTARRAFLGITLEMVDGATEVLRKALSGGRILTRDECVKVLQDAGYPTAGQVSYHLLWYACQVGVLCQGPPRGKEHTFVVLGEWVPDARSPSREEGLAILAERFFRGHGPASVKDFARWTALGIRECRVGIAGAGEALVEVGTSAGPMVTAASALGAGEVSPHLVLPGFDEFMLGYGDRALILEPEHFKVVVPGGNGVFQATLVKDGRAVGVWKRSLKAKTVDIAVTPLVTVGDTDRRAFEREFAAYGAFLGREPRVTWAA